MEIDCVENEECRRDNPFHFALPLVAPAEKENDEGGEEMKHTACYTAEMTASQAFRNFGLEPDMGDFQKVDASGRG